MRADVAKTVGYRNLKFKQEGRDKIWEWTTSWKLAKADALQAAKLSSSLSEPQR